MNVIEENKTYRINIPQGMDFEALDNAIRTCYATSLETGKITNYRSGKEKDTHYITFENRGEYVRKDDLNLMISHLENGSVFKVSKDESPLENIRNFLDGLGKKYDIEEDSESYTLTLPKTMPVKHVLTIKKILHS